MSRFPLMDNDGPKLFIAAELCNVSVFFHITPESIQGITAVAGLILAIITIIHYTIKTYDLIISIRERKAEKNRLKFQNKNISSKDGTINS